MGCLVLEYLDDSMTVCKASEEGSMPAAARWAGLFHPLMQERLRHDPLAFLARYAADYYRRWSRQALQAAQPVLSRHPWFRVVCRRYEERIPLLTGGPATVVHGEFTPHNVLWQRGRVLPIDWESAAVGAGEIDLATLLDGWDEETARACTESYRQARWPRGAPPSFEETFMAARLYVAFRWFFDPAELAANGVAPPDLGELYGVAEGLGLL
jgi:thiamine kinase-like enzyme